MRPTATSTTVTADATAVAVSVRAAISVQAGTGVARRRFRTPVSRCVTTEITRLTNDDAITASAASPGT